MDERLRKIMKKAIAEGKTIVEKTRTGEIEYFRDEETGILYPIFELDDEEEIDPMKIPFGLMWKEYLLENKRHEITTLVMTGKLNRRMLEIQEMAEDYRKKMVQELLNKNPVPETDDILERASHLNHIHKTAGEMVVKDIIEKVI